MANNIDEELKIVKKLDRFYVEYDLTLLDEVDEVRKGIVEVKVLAESYEDVHLKLKRELGNELYEETYADYENQITRVSDWIKGAKSQIQIIKTKECSELKSDTVGREKEKYKAEEKYFRSRIKAELETMSNEDSSFIEDLEKNVTAAQELRQGYSEIFIKIETFGNDFLLEFGKEFEDQTRNIDLFVQDTRSRIETIKMTKLQEKKQYELSEVRNKADRDKREKIVLCNNIYDNICDRLSNLELKCSNSVHEITNRDLLIEKRELKTLDSEFNQILDRLTKLSEKNPDEFVETRNLLTKAFTRKENLKVSIDLFKTKLEKEICERDLSEEKMNNASALGIKLPKFKGYDSEMDFYTFRSEFEKLIAPRVFSSLLPDYLKNNYLDGAALKLVKGIERLDQIWERLKISYGNVETVMSKKLDDLETGVPLWKIKSDEKLIQSILKMKNAMIELKSLAIKHNIEQNLFHSSNLAKVFNILGKKRQYEITKNVLDSGKNEQEKWDVIVEYLDTEMKIKEQMLLFEKSNPKSDVKPRKIGDENDRSYTVDEPPRKKCFICGKSDHIPTITKRGNSVFNYFACEKFAKMKPLERFEELRKKKLCFQCLTPGLKLGHEGRCFDRYKCRDDSHKQYKYSPHVLCCDKHKTKQENLDLLKEYKAKCIIETPDAYADFSNKIDIALHVKSQSYDIELHTANNEDMAIYMLQTILVGGKKLRIFFDSGCGEMIVRKSAVDLLEKLGLAQNIVKGPLILSGVGDQKTVCVHGRYQITLPLHDGKSIKLGGICLDKITSTFPTFPLREVEKDIERDYVQKGGDPTKLPKLPTSVGGPTDVMLGVQYLKYFPREIHKMANGLSLYESTFKSSDGTRGIVGGPHKSFNFVHKNTSNHVNAYYSQLTLESQTYFWRSLDIGLLDVPKPKTSCEFDTSFVSPCPQDKLPSDDGFSEAIAFRDANKEESNMDVFVNKKCVKKRVPKIVKRFEEVERAGTEVSYRCVRCRGCTNCRKSEKIECISLQEEMEQSIINNSVTVDLNLCCTSAYLPFICDPNKKLASNYSISENIYNNQVKRMNLRSPKDKQNVIDAFTKLIDLGFITKYDDLSKDEKHLIDSSPVRYYIPWTAVWNSNSLSTPCRPVFNASCPTKSGYSLNDLLPKGKNSLNKLVQIFIRWMIYTCAFHSDIQKMYNTIRLVVEHWCYQLCLFESDLNVNVKPLVYVIKTLIYGVRSSGNQAERAVRETAKLCKDDYPRQNEIVQNDLYCDDCFSGDESYTAALAVTDGLQIVLSKGGFLLKGITFSGFDPPVHLCNDDKSINVAGMKWFPKLDIISLNLSELKFGKKVRGKKPERVESLIPETFTRRNCAGRVGEVFDLIGRFTPLIAELKLDLHELSVRKLDWDDVIPPDLVSKWKKNFNTISNMREVKFKRCVVPEDAVNLDMDTIEMADASLVMACSVAYVRFKRKNGLHSCQIVFAKSKIVPEGMSIHRAELLAAELNAVTGHVVKLSLGKYVKSRIHLTDNQIALSWISNPQLALKSWPRNRVVEICRLTDRTNWFYIEGKNMTADIGTRRGAKLEDVLDNSTWACCIEWAKCNRETFPIKSFKDIKLNTDDLKNHDEEIIKFDVSDSEWISKQLSHMYCNNYPVISTRAHTEISQRYKFSDYVVDPNKFRFRKTMRIVALVFLFIRNLKRIIGKPESIVVSENKIPEQLNFCHDRFLVTKQNSNFPITCQPGLVVELTEKDLNQSINYFYKKASLEIKHFRDKKYYEKMSKEKFGILYYTGRILPSQKIDSKLHLSDVCIDLSASSFCVPLVDKYSPLAYALINEVHWYDDDAKHAGNETVMRFVQKIAHILEARPLIKMFRNECPRCKYLNKKAVDVAMGQKSCNDLTIAPAFYTCQCDLFGPYNAYSNANKRATVKVWFAIFCCCATGAIDIKVTEDYSTSSFILAFIRFSCKVGYPRKVLPDAGSQLVKGCESMKITFSDIKKKLHEYGVDFEVCPVGAHYMHGKVERKIKHVKESFSKQLQNNRLSIMQWETLGDQIANSINNLPISLGNITQDIENLDLLTPNRLLLARNNARCPEGPLVVTEDVGKLIPQNNAVFEVWFRAWLTSYVPTLMFQPKWFNSDYDPKEGDIVLFLKSEKDFERIYQYGMICNIKKGRDGKIRQVEVEYQNYKENVKRRTNRGTREIVVIHPHNELGLVRELNVLASCLS